MEGLSERLSGPVFRLGKPGVDLTGIKGVFDFILKWAPDDSIADERLIRLSLLPYKTS